MDHGDEPTVEPQMVAVPAAAFTTGQRVWHWDLGWCTYCLLSWDGTSEVLIDRNADVSRISTEALHVTDADGAGPPPVPPAALAQFEEYGLTPPV